ncbi:MAG: ATP-binding cassette domain-containing protein [Actinomycetota bacterium]|nr:ABC transporter ATP-binding protein [Actinomycetota bacterium]
MNEAPVITFDRVTRAFGDVTALDGLSLSVKVGTVTALLGANGAGKTTAVRVVTGALRPSNGFVRVFGVDPRADGESVRRRCGVVSARPGLYDRLTGRDNLEYAAQLYGLGSHAPVEDAAARFGIVHALDQRVGGYSTGMKTRLALSRAVLHDPELLLLDEPTAGLDPESARAVLSLIDEMATGGKSVLLCTHLLLEAEGLADEVIILSEGREIVSGSPEELTHRYWQGSRIVIDAEDRSSLDVIRDFEGVVGFELNGHAIVQLDDLSRVPDLVVWLTSKGVRLTRVDPRVPTLEDMYFAAYRERPT